MHDCFWILKRLTSRLLIAALMAVLFCWPNLTIADDDVIVEVESGLDVAAYYKKIGFYDIDRHPERLQFVPRTRIVRIQNSLSDAWRDNVALRKSVFFRLALSAVLQVNETIIANKNRLLDLSGESLTDNDRRWITSMMGRYKVKIRGDQLTSNQMGELAHRMDTLPPSLVMAQGAVESGWLQSRFAREGQAIFGQWTTSEQGIKALESNVRLASFSNPRESLIAYMLNINTHPAYSGLRDARARMRRDGQTLDGYALAKHIEAYAETGDEYVSLVRKIIRHNGFKRADTAQLASGPQILFRLVD